MPATESQSIWCFISKWCSANVIVDITNFVLNTYSPLEFDYRKKITYIWQKLMTWNKRDEIWKTMNSLFTRHSGMSLRAGCQLISQLKNSLHQLKLLWKTKTWSNFDSVVEYKSLLSFSSATSLDNFSPVVIINFKLPIDPGLSDKIEVQACCLTSTALKELCHEIQPN